MGPTKDDMARDPVADLERAEANARAFGVTPETPDDHLYACAPNVTAFALAAPVAALRRLVVAEAILRRLVFVGGIEERDREIGGVIDEAKHYFGGAS